MTGLTVLAVDDEAPALDELAYLLDQHPDIAAVHTAGDATSALRELNAHPIDAVFLDINMPGLSGIELAGVLRNFANRPAVATFFQVGTRTRSRKTSYPASSICSRIPE